MSNETEAKPKSLTVPLPDSTTWRPRDKGALRLAASLLARCHGIESQITARVEYERESARDNFDSGVPIEDVVRDELAHLVPARYAVTVGEVVDRNGNTAGDCDIILFNKVWFPLVKHGPSPVSRSVRHPIEGVYAVGEVKQTLSQASLDSAMQKLVSCHRLDRNYVPRGRLVENRHTLAEGCGGVSNPLYSFILAAGVDPEDDFLCLVERYLKICETLDDRSLVRALCVIGKGVVLWGAENSEELAPALFLGEEVDCPIMPVLIKATPDGSALYSLVTNLLCCLFHVVLGPEDLAVWYGDGNNAIQVAREEARLPKGLPYDQVWNPVE